MAFFRALTQLRWIKPRTVIFIHDLFMVSVGWCASYWLRFNLDVIPQSFYASMTATLPLVLLVQGFWFRFFGLYRGLWRFASIPDFIRVSRAVAVGAISLAVVLFLFNRLENIPRSIIPLYCIQLMLLLCTPRLFYRYWKESCAHKRSGSRALIVGAGRAGEMLVRELLREDETYTPIGFVDDDPRKRRSEIHGVRVLGSCRKIARFADEYKADIILIAIPSAKDYEMQRLVALCEVSGCPFLTVPSLREIGGKKPSSKTLRDVSIEDLLGRKSVQLAWDLMHEFLEPKRVMVTGGGGSIGSELCRQLAELGVRELVIFEKSEYALYHIEHVLRRDYPGLAITAILGDVVDRVAVSYAMNTHKPQVVFHAAAYKHVPLLEGQAREAVRNNVIGSHVVASEAIQAGVEHFTLISSDKAVNPTNVMGATKRVAEMLCQYFHQQSQTQFVTVRFGNVLDSAGSVVPLFREQIARGGPVTVTHPDITRYFMTIPEASQLIMEATVVGNGGEIFVLDMGEPIRISFLAEQMIRLSSSHEYNEIEIQYTGLRPGEKLHEELFHKHENVVKTGHQKLMLAQCRKCEYDMLMKRFRALEQLCESMDNEAIVQALLELVPEFECPGKQADNLISFEKAKAKSSTMN